MSIGTVTTGQGVTSTNSGGGNPLNYIVTGHCFNPSLGSYIEQNYASSYSPSSSFDLTDYYPGTEVVMAVCTIYGPDVFPITSDWYNPNGTRFYAGSFGSGIILSGDWRYTWSYVGCKPPDNKGGALNSIYGEIYFNGQYSVGIGTAQSPAHWAYVQISNVNSSRMTMHYGSEGDIWVDGQNIHFICWDGHEIIIANDGVNYGNAGGTTTGSIWVPNISSANYLCYVDFSGYIRHTKNGDTGGWAGYDGVGTSGHTPGYIWVESGFNATYLMFINNDGWQVRLSSGYMFGNSQ